MSSGAASVVVDADLASIPGFTWLDPIEAPDWVNYEPRSVKCARCGRQWRSPYPMNSTELKHRPRCGGCGSQMSYLVGKVSTEGSKVNKEGAA